MNKIVWSGVTAMTSVGQVWFLSTDGKWVVEGAYQDIRDILWDEQELDEFRNDNPVLFVGDVAVVKYNIVRA
jgi:hypothetical protein